MTTVVEFAYKLVFRLSLVDGIVLSVHAERWLTENGSFVPSPNLNDTSYGALIESSDKRTLIVLVSCAVYFAIKT